MELLSINVGQPQIVKWRGRTFKTSIFKEPVTGSVAVGRLNVDGDRQSDLEAHGGVDKAVYVYPSNHYPFWQAQYPDVQFPWGVFGENLTVSGMREDTTHIGDTFRIGTAEFTVTQPRLPCFKLGARLDRPDVDKRMMQSGHTGFYAKVTREGNIEAGDSIEWLARDEHRVSVLDLVIVQAGGSKDAATMKRALLVEALSGAWRDEFTAKLAR